MHIGIAVATMNRSCNRPQTTVSLSNPTDEAGVHEHASP